MKVFLINLNKDLARLSAADAQLKAQGVSYVRVEAVYAKKLPSDILKRAVSQFRWWCAVGRPVRVGEIGCAMSHYKIYNELQETACVLEDDVILDPHFRDMLERVELWVRHDRPQVILLSNHVGARGAGIVRSKSDMYSEGYVITPAAAQALVKENWPLKVPCDHWGRWARQGIIELYHALPSVCSQNLEDYSSSIAPSSAYNVSKLSRVRRGLHKLMRLCGVTIDRILEVL